MAEILIIEDDSKLREHIHKYLNQKGHEAQQASDGWTGLEYIMTSGCDLVVLDIKVPGLSGIEVLRKVTTSLVNHPPIIIITGHGDKALAIEALRFGAYDFLEKPFHPELLLQTIERALNQKKPEILAYRATLLNGSNEKLTEREQEVARLVTQGLSNDDIALKLKIGSETVKTHLKHIYRKLGVENRTSLTARLSKVS